MCVCGIPARPRHRRHHPRRQGCHARDTSGLCRCHHDSNRAVRSTRIQVHVAFRRKYEVSKHLTRQSPRAHTCNSGTQDLPLAPYRRKYANMYPIYIPNIYARYTHPIHIPNIYTQYIYPIYTPIYPIYIPNIYTQYIHPIHISNIYSQYIFASQDIFHMHAAKRGYFFRSLQEWKWTRRNGQSSFVYLVNVRAGVDLD